MEKLSFSKQISFTGVGIEGSCPAEKDNDGFFFLQEPCQLRAPEQISARKEFCDCEFAWHFHENDAHGVSMAKPRIIRASLYLIWRLRLTKQTEFLFSMRNFPDP